MKRFFTIFSLSAFVFLICGAPTITFQALTPAILDVPKHINSIAIIDRSTLKDTKRNILEGGLTGEMPGGDKIAAEFAQNGLIDFLNDSRRFTAVRTAKTYIKNSAAESFPDPMVWNEIEKLCNEFKVDAIIALEAFDSDFIIPTNMFKVHVGFRLYDPKEKVIFDQNHFIHESVWEGRPHSVLGAINMMTDKERAIKDISYEAGLMYGERIAPSWYTVRREYYRKPKRDRNLREGSRMMEVNNWDAAIESLGKATDSNKRKTRGRAAHNLAVVYEILGDYEQAQKWAQDAWGRYENKDSKNYSYILGQRMKEMQILKEQQK